MKVSVVILNWNTKGYLRKFLPGVVESCRMFGDACTVVADSGSTDGSVEMLTNEFPDVKVLPLGDNFGFTGGYNRAMKEIGSEYAVLLNSDVEVTEGWLTPLVDWMDSHPDCCAAGPKILSWSDRGSFEYAGAAGGLIDAFGYPFCRGRVPGRTESDHGQYDAAPADVFWVSGACMMVRMDAWRELGGLDDRFFAHMEEIDFCWRAQLAGYRISAIPQSSVYHVGGGTLKSDSPEKLRLNFRNNLLLLENNLARTVIAEGKSEGKALRISRRRIFERMVLDGAAAVAYFISGSPAKARAVISAHKGYRELRHMETAEALREWAALPHHNGFLKGVYVGSIVLASVLYGHRIFEHITDKVI